MKFVLQITLVKTGWKQGSLSSTSKGISKMVVKKALLSLSAAAMVIAPVAAQAGTTAAASMGKLSSVSGIGMRQSANVKKKSNAEAGTVVLAAVGVAAVGTGIYLVAKKDDKSNGS